MHLMEFFSVVNVVTVLFLWDLVLIDWFECCCSSCGESCRIFCAKFGMEKLF